MRYSFSGHESFHCKPLWLKKGFDHLNEGHTFLDDNAVVELGVGKKYGRIDKVLDESLCFN